jgi:hypothetical protein
MVSGTALRASFCGAQKSFSCLSGSKAMLPLARRWLAWFSSEISLLPRLYSSHVCLTGRPHIFSCTLLNCTGRQPSFSLV